MVNILVGEHARSIPFHRCPDNQVGSELQLERRTSRNLRDVECVWRWRELVKEADRILSKGN